MRMKLFVPALLMLLAAGPAYPQNKDIQRLEVDIIDLGQRVKEIQKTVDQNDAALKGLVEKIADQVNTLAGAMQKVNGAVDLLKLQNDSTTRDVRTALTGVTNNIKEVQDGMASLQTQMGDVARAVREAKTTAVPLEGPNDLWRTASLDYVTGNFDLAISGYQEFLSKYPTDPRAAEANLNIGESLSALKKFDQAVNQYDIVLQKYPESDKSRTALLKKGLAQAETNPPQAVKTLSEVVAKFPNTSEAAGATAKLKELTPAARPRAPGR